MLTAILITKNEAKNIEDCLRSLLFCDEIIIVDANSTDNTIKIAKNYPVKIIQTTEWHGFGVQKNKALVAATGDWILSIDADERISDSLAFEILETIGKTQIKVFKIPRLSWYCGAWIKHGGWRPDHVIRLFKKGVGEFSNDLVHERFLTKQPIGCLKNDLIHYSFMDFESVLGKINNYSTMGAKMRFESNKTGSLLKAIFHGLWTFIRCYFIKLGFLDGKWGFILAISNAEGSYYRYLKLMLLHDKTKN